MSALRVVIADDDAAVRRALRDAVERAGFEVVGEAHDADGAIAQALRLQPDCLLCDLRMPPEDEDEDAGVAVAATVRRDAPEVGVVVMSHYADATVALRVLGTASQGVGYAVKTGMVRRAVVRDLIVRVAALGTAVDAGVVEEVVAASRTGAAVPELSTAQTQVLGLLARGRTDAEIAECLEIDGAQAAVAIAQVFAHLGRSQDADVHARTTALLSLLHHGR